MRLLFTGNAPVHFVCFKPLFERLRTIAGVEVHLSGGIASPAAGEDGSNDETPTRYDLHAMYGSFDVPPAHLRTVDEIASEHYDVLVVANSAAIEPGSFDCCIEVFHGLSFRNRALRPRNAGKDVYFLLGPYMKRAFDRAGLAAPGARTVDVGFPKTDRLLRDGVDDLQPVARRYGATGRRAVVTYAPTGARDNSLETMGEAFIAALARTGRYHVLVKPHDHPKDEVDWAARLAPLEDEHVRVVRDPDVVPLLALSDLLVTDASSVANEFTLLDRPIVFLDVPALIAYAASQQYSALDLATWGRKGGVVARDVFEGVRAVGAELGQPRRLSGVRRSIASDLFFNPGRATDTAIGWLAREFGFDPHAVAPAVPLDAPQREAAPTPA